MTDRVRIHEPAKELSEDAEQVRDVLQTMNVDVKNDMSTIDEEASGQAPEKAKSGRSRKAAPAKAKEGRPAAAREKKKEEEQPKSPAREANPARASLLDLYFGEGAGKASTKGAEATRPRRAAVDGSMPGAERPALAGERPASRQRPVASQPAPVAEARPQRRSPRPSDVDRPEVEVHAEQGAEVAPLAPPAEVVQPASERLEPVAAAPEPAPAARPEPPAEAPVEHVAEETPPVVASAPEPVSVPVSPVNSGPRVISDTQVREELRNKVEEGVVGELQLTPPKKIEQPRADAPRPDGPRPKITIGLPTPPRPPMEGPRPQLEGPRPQLDGPRPQLDGPRPVLDGPRPALGGPRPAGLGAPRPSIGGPRPAGAPGAPRPGRPGFGGGFDKDGEGRGPRPGGGRPGGGFGRPGGAGRPGGFGGGGGNAGGRLVIPKVDPKLAAQQPEQRRGPLGQGGDRRKGDAFSKRENQASRPTEEKLFGRRYGGRAAKVERRSLRPITIEGPMTVKELAAAMGITAGEVIKKLLTDLGVMATINQELDTDTCVLIGDAFGVSVNVKEPEYQETYERVEDENEDESLKKPRWPVVTVMGHVDHGKTSLLDAIRSARVAAGEAGGITQHIGAYTVEQNGKKITFLDTPGHEAFTAMRARGANVTDVAVLVVAADDSVMPQTIESINHAKAAGVPIVVAVNKIDKPGANPDKVKQDLTQYGLVVEEWGGDTIAVPVSAKQRIGIDKLLEMILLVAEVGDLRANPDKDARGTVLEAQLDKGRGPVATVLIQAGTLHAGDAFVAGTAYGKVRAMFDDKGKKLKKAGPSVPVQILGFATVPSAGDIFRVAPDEKTARDVAEKRQNAERASMQATTKVTLEDLMNRSAAGEIKDLNLVIKGDVQGSVEAIRGAVEQLKNEEVQVKVVHNAVGAISESDVMLAAASRAIIYGFNVRPDDRATRAAAEQQVDIRLHRVIYDIVDELKAAMTGMLKPKFQEVVLGKAEVRQTFRVPKAGTVAGCMVLDGKIVRTAQVRLVRDGVVVWEGNIDSLKRFKDDAKDVAAGFECGIGLERFNDVKEGDIIEAFEMKEIKAGE